MVTLESIPCDGFFLSRRDWIGDGFKKRIRARTTFSGQFKHRACSAFFPTAVHHPFFCTRRCLASRAGIQFLDFIGLCMRY